MVRDVFGLAVDLPRRLGAIGNALADSRRDLRELLRTSQRQEGRVRRIEEGLAHFNERLTRIETLVASLERDVDAATDRLPDPNKGPLDKARDALTSS